MKLKWGLRAYLFFSKLTSYISTMIQIKEPGDRCEPKDDVNKIQV